MHIFRALLVGLASFIFMVALTGFVYVFTLQTSIMDRSVVKNWLNESQLYDGRLITALVQTTNAGGEQNGTPQPTTGALSVPPEAIKTALNTTFTPQFTQTQIEGVVNSTYDWIDGNNPEFTFSIPIDQKRDTLVAELSKALQPQIAALPVCQTTIATQQSACRPPNVTVEQFTSQLTAQSVDESGAFTKPITHESFSQANQDPTQQPQQTTLSQLPAIRAGIDMLVLWLPIIAGLSLGVIVLATTNGQHLARIARLSRRVFFGMLFIFLPTIIVVWIAKGSDFGLSTIFAADTGQLIVPLIKTIAVGILGQLALVTGVIGAISAAAWIAFRIWQHSIARSAPTPHPVNLATQDHIKPTQLPPQQMTDDVQPDTNYQR